MQVGLDIVTSTNCKSKLWFGLDKQLSTLVLTFNFIFSISSGCGQTEHEFPTCIKPCSLHAILMTASELISAYRELPNQGSLLHLTSSFEFKPVSTTDGHLMDANLEFRAEIVESLLHDFSQAEIHLIRQLFAEEMKCELATHRHDNLYQLCYYLYDIGDLQDTFIIYDAKFNANNMDAGLGLDREMICVGHEVDDVIKYIQEEFKANPKLANQYPKILTELNGLKEFPDYESTEAYSKFIKGYFFGHDTA
ncbi:hypothetical protein [Foetidibacter luteolus]|uniref:hypothetical protein n=1 Tax=Foetidibacter luteolus TaxID=2608880 RepID=UPI00129A9F43|nr:hypothetical protein [Foetidibacter luteolus]